MRTLTWKITLSLIATSLLGVVFVAVFAGVFTRNRFEELRLAEAREAILTRAEAYYRENNTLAGVQSVLPVPGQAPGEMAQRRGEGRQRNAAPVAFVSQFYLVDADGILRTVAPWQAIGERVPPEVLERGEPFFVDGERVGTLIQVDQPPVRGDLESQFIQEVNRGLLLAALSVLLAASLVGVTLAQRLTTPLRELTLALRGMEAGKLEQRVKTQSQDEIGDLVMTFNRMSAEVARANQLRRQMTADIAHDLRTPLSVIAGYLEALRDGTLPPTQERFETLHTEATLLQRLVEDLRTLSLVDSGELTLQPERIELGDFLRDVERFYQPRAEADGITLHVQLAQPLPALWADRMRLGQILGNLISNALRHTPAGGRITVGAEAADDALRLWVRDTGEGIPPERLSQIFHRFYRIDEARAQEGQTGLGLAIARGLVEAHGGMIRAESQPGQGTTMYITLPRGDG